MAAQFNYFQRASVAECNIQMTETGKMCTVPLYTGPGQQIFFSGCKKTCLLGRPQHMLHHQGFNHFSFHFQNKNSDAKMLFLTYHESYCIISVCIVKYILCKLWTALKHFIRLEVIWPVNMQILKALIINAAYLMNHSQMSTNWRQVKWLNSEIFLCVCVGVFCWGLWV